MAMAERLSVPQLQQAIQSGSLPAYIGVPLIEQKMKAQKQAAVAQQPESKPIAQEVMEQASGIDSVPSNLPVSGYNEGGIVAFAAGGDVDDDFDYEAYLEQQEESDYDDIIRKYVAEADAAGIEGIPINRTKKVEQKYAEGGITRLQVGGDVIERMRIEDPEGYARMMREIPVAPASHATYVEPRLSVEQQAGMNDPMVDIGMMRGTPDVRAPSTSIEALAPSPTTPNVAPTGNTPFAISDDEADARAGTSFSPVGRAAPAGNQGSTQGGSPRANAPRGSGSSTGEAPRSERPKSAFDDFMADIKASRDDLNKQKSQDKYMALLSAGLGMMSGTSPNAFANIGQGAQMGVASYGASQKQRAAERAALNKNLLMGQRYQSMEDIANRTADVNEARYRDVAAARAAGAGSASKAEDQVRRQIADMGRLAETRFRTLSANVQKINPYLDPEGHRAAQAALSNDPELVRYNTIMKQLTNKLYGLSDETPAPTAQSGNKPPLSSFVR
jgi:hypothetical protein